MRKEEIKEKYENVGNVLDQAIKSTNNIELLGEDENIELGRIVATLSRLNLEFKAEIEKLESSSEWEKLCIAFFGETNAGKSTIIESLRIIFDEESRRQQRLENIASFEPILVDHCKEYESLVSSLKNLNFQIEQNIRKEKIKTAIKYFACTIIGFCIGIILF